MTSETSIVNSLIGGYVSISESEKGRVYISLLPEVSQRADMKVEEAYIDDRNFLILRGKQVYWERLSWEFDRVVGTHNGKEFQHYDSWCLRERNADGLADTFEFDTIVETVVVKEHWWSKPKEKYKLKTGWFPTKYSETRTHCMIITQPFTIST